VEDVVFVLFYNEELEALEKTEVWHPALRMRRNDEELRLYDEPGSVDGWTDTDLERGAGQVFLGVDVRIVSGLQVRLNEVRDFLLEHSHILLKNLLGCWDLLEVALAQIKAGIIAEQWSLLVEHVQFCGCFS